MRRRGTILAVMAVAAACGAAATAAAAGLQIAGNAYAAPSAPSGPRFLANVEFGPGPVSGPAYAIVCYAGACRTARATPGGTGSPTEVEVPFSVRGGRAQGRRVVIRAAACSATLGCTSHTFRWTVTAPVSPG